MKTYSTRTPKARGPVQLADLIAREHSKIAKLANQLEGIRRRLARARMRYSVLNRLQLDAERRNLQVSALPTASRLDAEDDRALAEALAPRLKTIQRARSGAELVAEIERARGPARKPKGA